VPYVIAPGAGGDRRRAGLLFIDAAARSASDVSAGSARTATPSIRPAAKRSRGLRDRGGHDLHFLIIILGATDPRAPQGFAPIAIASASP